ncbi:MAG TPA: hypothetical protein VIK59_08385 [Verrucomicrobiae bacterium]
MNSNLIRERLKRETKPFVFRLSDGSPVAVAHPDFAAVAPRKIKTSESKGKHSC